MMQTSASNNQNEAKKKRGRPKGAKYRRAVGRVPEWLRFGTLIESAPQQRPATFRTET